MNSLVKVILEICLLLVVLVWWPLVEQWGGPWLSSVVVLGWAVWWCVVEQCDGPGLSSVRAKVEQCGGPWLSSVGVPG